MSDKLLQEELSDDLFERLDDSEKNAEKIAYESRTYLADAWHRFRQNKLAFVGFCFLMFMLLCAIIIPMISPYTYDGQNLELRNIGPSLQHLMGTDKFGRDILVRIMWGGRVSLSVGFAAALISLGVGVLYGGIAGYFGGKIDGNDAVCGYDVFHPGYAVCHYDRCGHGTVDELHSDRYLYLLLDGDGPAGTSTGHDAEGTGVFPCSQGAGSGNRTYYFQASDYQQYGADHRICHNAGSKCDIL